MRLLTACTLSIFILVTTLSSAFAADPPALGKRQGVKPRNVVFFLTDDHRFDAMGFTGHPFLETPHLDSLASNGVHLKNAFVTTSLCSPSRASILTGLYRSTLWFVQSKGYRGGNFILYSALYG